MMLAMCTSITVIILNLHHRGKFGTKLPRFVRLLVLDWMARIMFLKNTVDRNTQQRKYLVSNEKMAANGRSNEMWSDVKSATVLENERSNGGISRGEREVYDSEKELKGTRVEQV